MPLKTTFVLALITTYNVLHAEGQDGKCGNRERAAIKLSTELKWCGYFADPVKCNKAYTEKILPFKECEWNAVEAKCVMGSDCPAVTTPSKITTRSKAISITNATNSFLTITPNHLPTTTTIANAQDKDDAATDSATVANMITTRLLRRTSHFAHARTIAANAESDNRDAVPQGTILSIIAAGSVVLLVAIIIAIVIVYIRKKKKDLSEDRYSFPRENKQNGYGNSNQETVQRHTSFAN